MFSVLCVIRVLIALGTLLKWVKDVVYFIFFLGNDEL